MRGRLEPPQCCLVGLAGRPLAGKTTAATLLHEDRGWPVVEADELGEELLAEEAGVAASLAFGRRRFPYADAARVEFEAPDRFRALLEARFAALGGPCVVVGLRSASTVRWLASRFPRRFTLVYLSAGIRVCERRFVAAAHRPGTEYPSRLESAVESDQPALRRLANRVLASHSTVDALRANLRAYIDPDGRAHHTSLETCSACGRLRPVHRRAGTERAPLCRSCYEWTLNAEPCSQCHERRPVHHRDPDGRPLCGRCYQRTCNLRACVSCGRAMPVYRRNLDGDPVCRRCWLRGAGLEHTRQRHAVRHASRRGTSARDGVS
jgi:hypothetical protein